MKKNITINLCGRLFQIDEDAYEMLQHYTDSLRSHFGKQEGGDEIANDIEARIAELFDELKQKGNEAITIEHVKDIITRIGKPEQLTDDEEQEESDWKAEGQRAFEQVRSKMAGRRLYRNPNDKMVAGVMSGIAAYTGVDVTICRLGAVLFTLCYGIGLIVYIVLAIVLPQANTPEEKLQMQGKEVNPQNLADAVVDDRQQPSTHSNGLREVFSVLLKIVIGFFVGIAILVGFVLAIAFFGVLMTTVFALAMPATTAVTLPFTLGGMGLTEVWNEHPALLIGFTISLLAVLFLPLYAIIHMILSLTKKIQPMGVVQRIVCIVLWMIALFCAIPLGSSVGMLHDQYRYERIAEDNQWMTDEDRDYLNANGWVLQMNIDCHNDYVKNGEYVTGDPDVAYLDVWDADAQQVFQVASMNQVVDSGTYRLTCNARAEGEGVYIYAKTPANRHEPTAITMIPVYGNEGGKIWEEALGLMENDSLPIAEQARKIREANDGKGFGWSKVELIVKVDKPKTTLCYGVSTWEEATKHPNYSKWFSACDFKLEKVENNSNAE